MTLRTPPTDAQHASLNWGAGLRGLLGAWLLGSSGLWAGSALPVIAAAVILAYALLGPLHLGRLVFTRAFVRLLLRIAILLAIVTTVAFPSSLAANSRQPTLAALGSILFIALLTITASILVGAARVTAFRTLPHVSVAVDSGRARASLFFTQFLAAARSAKIFG